MSPPIDTNLQSHFEHREALFAGGTHAANQLLPEAQSGSDVEMEHEVAFLLRHFSESPGQW